MRKILFRGKPLIEVLDEDTGEWNMISDVLAHLPKDVYDGSFIYGNLVLSDSGEPYIVGNAIEVTDDYFTPSYWIPVIPETVGQFIGVMAKHQTEVFEDDIVKWGYRYNETPIRIAIVKLNPDIELTCLNVKNFDGTPARYGWGNFAYNDIFEKDGEVIGNIHDNPELLK